MANIYTDMNIFEHLSWCYTGEFYKQDQPINKHLFQERADRICETAIAMYLLRFKKNSESGKDFYEDDISQLLQSFNQHLKWTTTSPKFQQFWITIQRLSDLRLKNMPSGHPLRKKEEQFFKHLFATYDISPAPLFVNEVHGVIVEEKKTKGVTSYTAKAVNILLQIKENSSTKVDDSLSWYCIQNPQIVIENLEKSLGLTHACYTLAILPMEDDCEKRVAISKREVGERSLELAIATKLHFLHTSHFPRSPVLLTGQVDNHDIQSIGNLVIKSECRKKYPQIEEMIAPAANIGDCTQCSREGHLTGFCSHLNLWFCETIQQVWQFLDTDPLKTLCPRKAQKKELIPSENWINWPEGGTKKVKEVYEQEITRYETTVKDAILAKQHKLDLPVPAGTDISIVAHYLSNVALDQREKDYRYPHPIVFHWQNARLTIEDNGSLIEMSQFDGTITWPASFQKKDVLEYARNYDSLLFLVVDHDGSWKDTIDTRQIQCRIYYGGATEIPPWKSVDAVRKHVERFLYGPADKQYGLPPSQCIAETLGKYIPRKIVPVPLINPDEEQDATVMLDKTILHSLLIGTEGIEKISILLFLFQKSMGDGYLPVWIETRLLIVKTLATKTFKDWICDILSEDRSKANALFKGNRLCLFLQIDEIAQTEELFKIVVAQLQAFLRDYLHVKVIATYANSCDQHFLQVKDNFPYVYNLLPIKDTKAASIELHEKRVDNNISADLLEGIKAVPTEVHEKEVGKCWKLLSTNKHGIARPCVRSLAGIIDFTLVLVVTALLSLVVFFFTSYILGLNLLNEESEWFGFCLILIWIGVWECLDSRQSFGKKLWGIEVICLNGKRPGRSLLMLRSLLFVLPIYLWLKIDGLPGARGDFFYVLWMLLLIAWLSGNTILILFHPNQRSIHDLCTRTLVVGKYVGWQISLGKNTCWLSLSLWMISTLLLFGGCVFFTMYHSRMQEMGLEVTGKTPFQYVCAVFPEESKKNARPEVYIFAFLGQDEFKKYTRQQKSDGARSLVTAIWKSQPRFFSSPCLMQTHALSQTQADLGEHRIEEKQISEFKELPYFLPESRRLFEIKIHVEVRSGYNIGLFHFYFCDVFHFVRDELVQSTESVEGADKDHCKFGIGRYTPPVIQEIPASPWIGFCNFGAIEKRAPARLRFLFTSLWHRGCSFDLGNF